MANVLQFVDKIDAAPTVRLDINDQAKFFLHKSPDFSPPQLKRVVVSTMMRDGAEIPASAYDNRVVKLQLDVRGASKDDLATNLQSLNRELDRRNNILKWQPQNATKPVFFRTFRSPDYGLNTGGPGEVGEVTNIYTVTLQIIAEPFAYGLKVTAISGVAVDNNPASVLAPQYIDVTGVTGDVPTPAYIETSSPGSNRQQLLAIRRHGTPPHIFFQAEAMTQGTDTTTQPNDAAYSGAGNNFSKCTFASPGMTGRLTTAAFPRAAPTVDDRGTYRVFVRVKKSDASVIKMRFTYEPGISGATVTIPNINLILLDLGLLQIPTGPDPVFDGYSNTQWVFDATTFRIEAERVSGAGTLNIDYVLLIPAGEALCIASVGSDPGTWLWDGPMDTVRPANAGTALGIFSRVGNIPLLAPNQTNRLHVLRQVTGEDAVTDTTTVTVSFWPRFLYIRS